MTARALAGLVLGTLLAACGGGNVGLHGGSNGPDDIYMTPVICISFGPNKTADTQGNMPGAWVGGPDYLIGGDDIAAVLSAAGPF